jgi:hypothetical protein
MSEPNFAGQTSVVFGADPEFFFTNEGGDIVGAEKVLPKNGKLGTVKAYDGKTEYGLVLDGVQVEMNPRPSTCRQSFSSDLKNLFTNLKNHLATHPEFKASFTSVVDIKKEELDGLSDKAKVFGCAPSLNVNGRGAEITVDAATYLKRAAGGHIHLGMESYPHLMKPEVLARLVPVLDAIVGNTCVMMDLDEGQKVRRLHYGRAGEYRLPKHGLEYRTLSNFWLRHYYLTSLVFGLSRLACSVWNSDYKQPRPPRPNGYTDQQYRDYYPAKYYADPSQPVPSLVDKLLEMVDIKQVEKAINENDLELAKKNYYEGVRPFIQKYVSSSKAPSAGLNAENLDDFDFFLEMIWDKGLEYWFPEDTLSHWTNNEIHGGWESYCQRVVRPRRLDPTIKRKIKEVLPGPKVEASTIEQAVSGEISPATSGTISHISGGEGVPTRIRKRTYTRSSNGKFKKAA